MAIPKNGHLISKRSMGTSLKKADVLPRRRTGAKKNGVSTAVVATTSVNCNSHGGER
jgi:hypothetical protein